MKVDPKIRRILASRLPGYAVIEKATVDSSLHVAAEASMLDKATLRNKYYGPKKADRTVETSGRDAVPSSPPEKWSDAVIVPVVRERSSSADPYSRGDRPQAVIVSPDSEEIVGSQG